MPLKKKKSFTIIAKMYLNFCNDTILSNYNAIYTFKNQYYILITLPQALVDFKYWHSDVFNVLIDFQT